ncbi:MAG: glycosyltransferase family 2 protein [Denitrobacterium sp.]|jgi:glycosyltransferase involved in cell wall biosynthesis|nr:glycosyltransferase family 2 protein [Denitrobacterium sp.]
MTQRKVLLIIPAYNEEESIERVVDELIADYPQYDYVVVNDGSKDSTATICRSNGYRFLDLPINLGLAGAFQAGLKYAYMRDYDCAIQIDGDGQHRPEYIESLVREIGDYDIVIGSRFVNEDKPKSMRMLGSNLISGIIKLTTGVRINDPTSGMRAYNKKMIKELAFGPNLGPEPDTISYLIKRKGAQVKEVQVQMADRLAGESYLNLKSSVKYMTHMFFSVLFIQFFR